MIQAFLPLILWSIVGTDGLQLDASDSVDLDRVGPEIHGVFPDGIVDDVFGAGEFQDHHPFLFLITASGTVSQRPSTAGSIGVVCFSVRGVS